MKIFQKIKSSIYDPSFYENTVKTESLSSAIKYFFNLVLVISLISVLFGLALSPFFIKNVRKWTEIFANRYPAELEVVVKDGTASTNVSEPYAIETFGEMQFGPRENIKNIIVLDTKNPVGLNGLIGQFKNYSTAFLLTKDALIFSSGRGQIRVQELSTLGNFTVNQATVFELKNKIQNFSKSLPIFIVAVFFIGTFFAITSNLIYLLFGAGFIWLLMKVKKTPTSYKQAYIMGLHAMTLPVLIGSVLFVYAFSVPYLFTIVMLIIVWFNFKDVPNEENFSELKSE